LVHLFINTNNTNNTNSSIAASCPSATVNITAYQFSKMNDSYDDTQISVLPRKLPLATKQNINLFSPKPTLPM
jgi:hypothetical protein